MKVVELFEDLSLATKPLDQRSRGDSRSEYDANRELSKLTQSSIDSDAADQEWALYDNRGKIVRRELTQRAAEVLKNRSDLIKKFGTLTPRRLS